MQVKFILLLVVLSSIETRANAESQIFKKDPVTTETPQIERKSPEIDDLNSDTETEETAFTPHSSFLSFKENGWHFLAGLGVGLPIYAESGRQLSDAIQNESGTHLPLKFDLGVYFPTSPEKTWVQGVTLNGFIDNVKDDGWFEDREFQIGQALIGYSVLYFLDGKIGDGWLLRGDAGIAFINWSETAKSGDTTTNRQEDSSAGLGALIGGGYSWQPFSGGPRALLQSNLSYNRVAASLIGPISAWVLSVNGSILF